MDFQGCEVGSTTQRQGNIATIITMTNINLGVEVFASSYSFRSGSRGRNLETETDAEAIREYCLLACSACLTIASRITCPGLATSTMG